MQSRYYDPEVGRFFNADRFISTGGILGNNMFAYCLNDPIGYSDVSGNLPVKNDITSCHFMSEGGYGPYTGYAYFPPPDKYHSNPVINQIAEDVFDALTFPINIATDIITQDRTSAQNHINSILDNDVVDDGLAAPKTKKGFSKIKKGMEYLLLPVPTYADDVLGATYIVWGFHNIVMGIGEILNWTEE